MRFKPLFLLFIMLAAGDAAALGLGDISLHSRLGARLRAEIELLGVTASDQLSPDCFRLSPSSDAESGVPALPRGRLSIDRRNGNPRLLIRSDHTINDPVLLIRLRAGCNAEVLRDYMLILDPVEANAIQQAKRDPADRTERDSPQEMDSSRDATEHRRLSTSAGRPQRLKTETPESATPTTERRRSASRKVKPDTELKSDRLSISGNISGNEAQRDDLPLRLATELSDNASANASESQRTLLRLEYQVLTAIYDQSSQLLSAAEQVRKLESSFAELRAETELLGSAPLQTQAPSAAAAIPPAKKDLVPQAGQGPQAKAADNGNRYMGIAGMLALLGVVGLLVWFLRRHALKAGQPVTGLVPEQSPVVQAMPQPTVGRKPSVANSETVQTTDETLFLDDRPEPLPIPLPEREVDPQAARDATVLAEQNGFNPVIELADIMLAFGRIKGATEALLEYIEGSPGEALQPWVKLLDIYRQNGMRPEFESLSQRLKLHFNVAPSDWESVAALSPRPAETGHEGDTPFAALLSRLPGIGQITHVRDEIARTWDSAESLAYIDKLLRDNRQGERQGFALSTVNELLFLLDILEKRFKSA
ncbi:hypothetical protein [Propionivibrio sp.]|uniref:type IV pilus assembly protein FimV n=1 Tax=Propionivibrio sp. TaxID=2212460 RepID=UPI0025F46EFE|nr:hypothetical protein [Propionivibrio sp.]MBK8744734.1 hypothetical protein [Propionivibrio sp.]